MVLWIAFIAFIIGALALDLGVFNKNPHVITTKEAGTWTAIWVSCAALFSGVVYLAFGHGWVENPTGLTPATAVVKYITGYLIELSLSVDNIFIIALIFSSFGVPRQYQHEVLFYGVLGAVVFRALMILFGVALINQFSWIIYVFGVFLIFTAIRMLFHQGGGVRPAQIPDLPHRAPLLPGDAAIPRRQVLHQEARPAASPPLIRGADRHRGERHLLRGGQHPGHFGHHGRPVHRVQLQHPRGDGPALHVLPDRQHAVQVQVHQLQPGGHTGLCGREDAAVAHGGYSRVGVVERDRGGAGRRHLGFDESRGES